MTYQQPQTVGPWSDYDTGDVGAGAPSPQPSSAPGNAAPATAPAQDGPWADYATPAAQPDNTQYQGGFADELPGQAASHMAPEDETHITELLRAGRDDEAVRYASSKGFSLGNLSAIQKGRDATGQVSGGALYERPKPVAYDGAPGAIGRGVLDSITQGATQKVGALVGGTEAALKGGDFSQTYNRVLDENNGVTDRDLQDHPWLRLGGQILGGIALPSGMEGIGLQAGSDVLKAGGTMQDARMAARIAVRNRMAVMGGVYGAAHGAGSGDNLTDAATGAVAQGAMGAATAGLMGRYAPVTKSAFENNTAAQVATNAIPAATAEEAQRIASQYGINPTPATTGGAMSHAVQIGLGNLPGGMSAVSKGIARENTDVANAVGKIGDNIGTATTREGAGQAAVDGATSYQKSSRAVGGGLYDARDAAVGGPSAPVTLDDTQGAISTLTKRYPNSQTLEQLMQHPVIRKIAGMVGDASQSDGLPPELTLGEATDALSYVRSLSRKLAQNGTDPDQITAQLGSVQDGLKSDVYRAAAAADQAAGRAPGSEGSAVAAQQKADAFWADRKTALAGTFKLPLQSGAKPTEVPAERAYAQISADTNRVGGNLGRLRDAWFRLPETARNTIAATKLDEMGRAVASSQDHTGQAWSYETFLTNFDKMAPQARNIMFGARASEQLRDIAAYSARLRDLGKSRNFSNTAKNTIAGAVLATVGTAIWHGAPMEAVEAAATIPASYAAASLFLRTPAMRQWTQSALRIAAVRDPQSSARAGKSLVSQLTPIARANPAIASDVLQLQRHIGDLLKSTPATVAAQPPVNGVLQTQGNASDQHPQGESLQP